MAIFNSFLYVYQRVKPIKNSHWSQQEQENFRAAGTNRTRVSASTGTGDARRAIEVFFIHRERCGDGVPNEPPKTAGLVGFPLEF